MKLKSKKDISDTTAKLTKKAVGLIATAAEIWTNSSVVLA